MPAEPKSVLNIRLAPVLATAAKDAAWRRRISANAWVVEAIAEKLERGDPAPG